MYSCPLLRVLGKHGFAQPTMDNKSSVVFIKHDLIEQQELCITCSFGIDVPFPRTVSLSDGIFVAFLWEVKKPL